MPTILPAEPPPIESPPFRIARFSVDKYHQMIDSGAFTEDDRIELLDGWVVEKMPKGPAHELVVALLVKLLERVLPPGWHVRNQAPITMASSEPEPDLSVVRGVERDYTDHHPGPDDAAIVIEVADSTLGTDRIKAGIYAANGIPEYWIVNLPDRSIEVYREPDATGIAGYGGLSTRFDGQQVEVIVDGVHCGDIHVADCLP